MSRTDVVVVGAGVGGLVAAIDLAAAGLAVTVCETTAHVGGKLAAVVVDGRSIDAGPTVLTMRWVFEALFADAGMDLSHEVPMRRAEVLARHWWRDGACLDLHADLERAVDAIGRFAGASQARAYRGFVGRSARIYETLEAPFLKAERPSVASLVARIGPHRLDRLIGIRPFSSFWSSLDACFGDARLRQLFGRYATYCGSSPFDAPATLMLVAHVEREGVWLVDGGMTRLADALARVARALGVVLRNDCPVARIRVEHGRVAGVELSGDERIDARCVVANADARALAQGLLGADVCGAVPGVQDAKPSLSAVTWALLARTEGVELTRHNVFFSDDYRAEFDDLLVRARLPLQPTVYVCAQDRDAHADRTPGSAGHVGIGPAADAVAGERLFCLVNAPATAHGSEPVSNEDIRRCEQTVWRHLDRCGLRLNRSATATPVASGPAQFGRRFPGTGGALYGPISAGWRTTFARPGSRTTIPGLYLAGGSVHPGPGVPMAALSGRLAAASLLRDRTSAYRSAPAAMRGGTAMR
ncbi:MAG: 1-hydroxycarotenoid 3,4-desaturase CrtD [Lautropia sp.]